MNLSKTLWVQPKILSSVKIGLAWNMIIVVKFLTGVVGHLVEF